MNLTVVKNLQKQPRWAVYPDISDGEMYLIGKVTASWALLESLIIQLTIDLAKNSPYTLPADFVKTGTLDKTLKELKTLIGRIQEPQELRTVLSSILKRVNNLKVQRHTLTHGVFTWE